MFAEVFCDASDGEDGVNFVDVHGYAAWAEDLDAGGVQFHGNNSCRRFCGISAMRAKTSASQAFGSTSLRRAVMISVAITAARSAPRSEPANNHAFLPSAKPRSARSAALPYRRAVAATRRGSDRFSKTIRAFSSSDQRRRRPVSTTSSRFSVLIVWLTILNHQASPQGVPLGGLRNEGAKTMSTSKGPQVFPRTEYLRRLAAVKAEMVKREVEALVVTVDRSINYRTGYTARSAYVPQALVISVDEEEPTLILRLMDVPAGIHLTFLEWSKIIGYPESLVGNPEKDRYDAVIDFLQEAKLTNRGVGLEMIVEDFGYVLSETFRVTDSGADVLTRVPRKIFEI